ncbi:helix-turn-helix domain-containing protein [Flavobacterium sp.]|jgi:excisionase family DNA binding protein|uniref:helix-turn-helix domain-containing protein n=1 Tax=Flavobacterium sp. TaxID=239 RepID=UPI0037C01354
MVDQKYYTIQEAAKVLACDDETILAQIHSGELPAVNIARRLQSKRPTWRIAEGELGRWLLKRGKAANQEIASKQTKRPTPNQLG